MPMVPEVVAAYLAIAKIGAVSSPLFSGYGESAIRTRLEDAGAKLVITADGMPRAGKTVALKQNLDAALSGATSVEHCIVFSHMGIETPWTEGRDVDWDELLRGSEPSLDTAQLDAEAMLTLAYTSGTSGKPKGVVMTHCGFLTKAALDFSIIGDLKASDRFLWMSDFGWVIGTLSIVSSLQAGATLVLADGAPDFPGGRNRLLRIAQDLEVSYLGIAPTLVRAFMMNDLQEISRLDLSAIRIVISSGEPWTPDAWNWCQKHICGSAPLLNISGGTEVSCAILATTVIHPNKPCGFTGPVPGMGARVFDADGRPVSAGEVGELVLTQPSIGMTQGLWRDPDRYIETYWSSYRDVWRHGDWATIDADGIWFIHGRSDDTINIAGKRVGPAEIESLLMESGQIADAAAIAVPDDLKGVAILCVCVPMPGTVANEALAAKLSHYVVAGLGPPFRPREIVFADELPKTRNMKTMRRVVRTAYLGDDPGDLSSLVNPDCVGALERAFGRKGI
ncbi:MAG: AMP-binding protein [Proteobacteria bacterium]|nr:AMP-binding protein [Pseudomonadota bacterium]